MWFKSIFLLLVSSTGSVVTLRARLLIILFPVHLIEFSLPKDLYFLFSEFFKNVRIINFCFFKSHYIIFDAHFLLFLFSLISHFEAPPPFPHMPLITLPSAHDAYPCSGLDIVRAPFCRLCDGPGGGLSSREEWKEHWGASFPWRSAIQLWTAALSP